MWILGRECSSKESTACKDPEAGASSTCLHAANAPLSTPLLLSSTFLSLGGLQNLGQSSSPHAYPSCLHLEEVPCQHSRTLQTCRSRVLGHLGLCWQIASVMHPRGHVLAMLIPSMAFRPRILLAWITITVSHWSPSSALVLPVSLPHTASKVALREESCHFCVQNSPLSCHLTQHQLQRTYNDPAHPTWPLATYPGSSSTPLLLTGRSRLQPLSTFAHTMFFPSNTLFPIYS